MNCPPPVKLRRTSPPMPTTRVSGGVVGVCEWCGWSTPVFPSSGYVSSVAALHGLVLSDEPTPGVPVCPTVHAGIEAGR